MNDEIRDANLELLIGLRRHLEDAAKLRALLDGLLALAQSRKPAEGECRESDTAAK